MADMDVVVVDFDGQIEDFPVLIQTVDGLVADGVKGIVIDLQTLPFINSAALGYLVSAQKNLEDVGGRRVAARWSEAKFTLGRCRGCNSMKWLVIEPRPETAETSPKE